MARSALESLFEEAMRLDPKERATLMRLLSRHPWTPSRRKAPRRRGVVEVERQNR